MATVEQYNNVIKQNYSNYREGYYRLGYHLMPVYGWMNDIHAPVWWNGEYHIFANLNGIGFEPFASKGWAHFSSKDMVHYTCQPCPLVPSYEVEKDGCASGCPVGTESALWLLYTARNKSGFPRENQAAAYSKDGIHFSRHQDGQPVIWSDYASGFHCRDPFIFQHNGRYIMLLGNSYKQKARLLVYTSHNLIDWQADGSFCVSNGSHGHMWECPAFATVDGNDYLIISAEGIKGVKTAYYTGKLSEDGTRFTQNKLYRLDAGPDFYAPQTGTMQDGRKILLSWMNIWNTPMPTIAEGWAGAMTIPRELHAGADGLLESQPLAELKSLRKTCLEYNNVAICDDDLFLPDFTSTQYELRVTINIEASSAHSLALYIRVAADGGEYTKFILDWKEETILVDRSKSGDAPIPPYTAKLLRKPSNMLDVILFVDTSSVELFVDKGTTTITNRIYPKHTSNEIYIKALEGNAVITNIALYELGNCDMDFSYFE